MKSAELSDCPSSDTTHQSWKTGVGFAASFVSREEREAPWTLTALKVPHNDLALFALPPLETAGERARENADSLTANALALQGRPLAELRDSARRDVLEKARVYTSDLLGKPVPEPPAGELLFCSGHQPALFHPGVWVKNFAIDVLAQRAGGVGLNLVIDNDTISTRQLRVPTGVKQQPATMRIPFDDPAPAGPWEEAGIANPDLFESFGARVTDAMARWNIAPILSEMWPAAVAQSRRSPSLRDALTAVRVGVERRWGLSNLEIPLSWISETETFCWFASAILTRLPSFWEVYNSVLAEFRSVNRIRSQTHPGPALIEEDGWYEAPFWVWRAGGQKRHRVLAKACSEEVRLSDGREVFARLPISPTGDMTAASQILQDLPRQGIRFRTRALTTTLYARLCLADLFIHGIGGAKYDEMTDRIIARFFGLPAPGFLTLSCTVHLPLGDPNPVRSEQEQDLRHQLRDVQWNPERHLARGVDPEIEKLIAEKQSLIAAGNLGKISADSETERRRLSRESHDRHTRLKEIRDRLAAETSEPRERLEAERATLQKQLRANEVLQDREFSFGLYPEDKLRKFLTKLLP